MPPWPVLNPAPVTPPRLPQLAAPPAWLPGPVEVHVVGESFRPEAVQWAARTANPNGPISAVIVPEPAFAEHPQAVAVYVQTALVGYIAGHIAPRVHQAVLGFAAVNAGRLPACPARIDDSDFGPQVVLLLDSSALGLPAELFIRRPDMAKTMDELLGRLDGPPPLLTGHDAPARAALETAESTVAAVTENRERGPQAWPRLEKRIRPILDRLIRAQDPWIGRGWLALARAIRYQPGRRDETLRAYVEALHCDRSNAEAAEELFEYLAMAPYVPTLVGLFARLPTGIRPFVLPRLQSTSYGRDRHGRLDAVDGERLRNELMRLAERERDDATIAVLTADAGLRAEKDGDIEAAVSSWRRAIAAGSTDPKVADRLSIWLMKQGESAEAAAVLSQALRTPPESATLRQKLEKRLDRCLRAAA